MSVETEPAAAAEQGLPPGVNGFILAVNRGMAALKLHPGCLHCRRARQWSDWNLTPMPVAQETMGGLSPLLYAQFTCMKCGVARLHSLHVLGVEVKVEQSHIIQPNGQPAPQRPPLILP